MKLKLFSRLGILGRLVLLSVLVGVSFVAIFLVSSNTNDMLTASLTRQSAASNALMRCSTIERLSYDLQIQLYRAVNFGYQGYGKDQLETSAVGMEKSVAALLAASRSLSALPGLSAKDERGVRSLQDSSKDFTTAIEKAILAMRDDPKTISTGSVEVKFSEFSATLTGLTVGFENNTKKVIADSMKSSNVAKVFQGVFALVSLLVVCFFVFITIRSITIPIRSLVTLIEKVGTGDFREKTNMKRGDEIGKIAANVDALVDDMRSLIGTVKERIAMLSETGSSLSSNMEETGAAVIEINSNIGSTKNQLEEQSHAVREASAAIEQLVRSVQALSGMIANQSSVIGQSSASVEEMIANVESVAGTAHGAAEAATRLATEGAEGKAKIDEVEASVASIVRYSENLQEAAQLISQIASRTNLLAMNAAIEAAHAGDTGKGFAVVADEIRRLAEESTSQATDITADLKRVAGSIEAVRASAGSAVLSFGAILDKTASLGDAVRAIGSAMDEQRVGGRQVLESLVRLRDITSEISQGSSEMESGNAAILDQVERLKTVNMSVVQNNEEIRLGTQEINLAVVQTTELTSRNATLIGEVEAATDKFLI